MRGNSTVSVSPASAAGCASASVLPIGIDRSSTAGRIERRQASCTWPSSTGAADSGWGAGFGSAAAAGVAGDSLVARAGGAPASSRSRR